MGAWPSRLLGERFCSSACLGRLTRGHGDKWACLKPDGFLKLWTSRQPGARLTGRGEARRRLPASCTWPPAPALAPRPLARPGRSQLRPGRQAPLGTRRNENVHRHPSPNTGHVGRPNICRGVYLFAFNRFDLPFLSFPFLSFPFLSSPRQPVLPFSSSPVIAWPAHLAGTHPQHGQAAAHHPHPARPVRGQQEPRDPPDGAGPPRQAHPRRLGAGPRRRPPPARPPPPRRLAPDLHVAVPPHARDHRGHPGHPDGRPAPAVAPAPRPRQGLRGAAPARAGLWQLPALQRRDGAHVAGEGRLRPLLLPHPQRRERRRRLRPRERLQREPVAPVWRRRLCQRLRASHPRPHVARLPHEVVPLHRRVL